MLSLSVENVKCFGPKQTLDLSDGKGRPARWTIILGENGTGKTTLLQCIARMCQEEDTPTRPGIAWLRRLARDESSCVMDARVFMASSLTHEAPGEEVHWTLNVDSARGEYTWGDTSIDQQTVYPEVLCFGYGASRRMGTPRLSGDQGNDSGVQGLFEDTPLINAEEWLLRMDYLASRQPEASKDEFQHTRELLTRILPDVDDLRVAGLSTDGRRTPKPFVEAHTPYGWVPMRELGLGYQTLIAWMTDLIYRLYETGRGSDDPLSQPAVVLVDEIDLHLHPLLQRDLLPYLSEHLPNVQFIVTTHSPLVAVQSADDANIIHLRREGDHVVIDQTL